MPKFLINLANEEKERKEGREEIRRETISSSICFIAEATSEQHEQSCNSITTKHMD